MREAKARVRKWEADGDTNARLHLHWIGATSALERGKLQQLPPLPNSVRYLTCSGNSLTTLGSTLPPHLIELNCGDNCLTDLPPLPSTLTKLDCSDNTQLRALPPLPVRLKILLCSDVRKWQTLPGGLQVLRVTGPFAGCAHPPALPPTLRYLRLGDPPGWWELPDPPSWWELPALPSTLAYLHIPRSTRLCEGYPAAWSAPPAGDSGQQNGLQLTLAVRGVFVRVGGRVLVRRRLKFRPQ